MKDYFGYQGKVCVVTGAASGVGMGIGLEYASAPQLWQGLALLLAAYVLRQGQEKRQA